MPNNLSVKDGLGQSQTLKTFSGSNGHVPYHVIEEISGSSIGAVTASLASIDTKTTNLSSSFNSNLVIVNNTITGSNTLLTSLSNSLNANLVTLSSSLNTNLVTLSSSFNSNLVVLSSSLTSVSSSVASLALATTGSSGMFAHNANIWRDPTNTNTNIKSVIISNLTNGPLYIKLSAETAASNDFTYVVPISGTYEALERNVRVRHALTASNSTSGLFSYAYTY